MDVTDALVAAIPEWNVRVPLDEFAAMWRAAEPWYGVWMPNPRNQGRVTGIVEVCRWLAGVTQEAPVTGRLVLADEVTIEAEVLAIEETIAATEAGAPPAWTLLPPGRADGVILAFTWAWLAGELPIHYFDLPEASGA